MAAATIADISDLLRAVAWPLVALIALLVATSNRGRRLIRPILRRVRKVAGPGGWAIELSEEAAAITKRDVQGALNEYASALNAELSRLAHAERVRDRMIAAVEELLDTQPADLRATVHIQDALYVSALYQLVDYWPRGRGSGRRFSARFGILGRAWRLEQSQHNGDIEVSELIERWGMTQEEAADAARGRKSFVCILLRHEQTRVGVLYMDAPRAGAFSDGIERVAESPAVSALAASVDRVWKEIAKRGPGLELLEND
jgi:hypothetical protein